MQEIILTDLLGHILKIFKEKDPMSLTYLAKEL